MPSMGDHEEIYQYQSINAEDQIRVLRLEPGAFAEPLIGSLLVRKLGDDEVNPPRYHCISYAWGSARDFTTFTCDGKGLRITAVVDEMLRYLRKPTKPHHLWIDASMYRLMLDCDSGANIKHSLHRSRRHTGEKPASALDGQNLCLSSQNAYLARPSN